MSGLCMEFDKHEIVFEGSSPEDVSHAKLLWTSLSLLPPLESRLVSSDIRQRLPVARPRPGSNAAPTYADAGGPLRYSPKHQQIIDEEKLRFLSMAKTREEIMALLRRQREHRIQKEEVSRPYKPKLRDSCESDGRAPSPSEDLEKDIREVKELQ